MVQIVQSDNLILREISNDVPLADIKKDHIKKILSDMSIALDSQDDGVAIAAPQIGISLRIFIVSKKIFDKNFTNSGIDLIKKENTNEHLVFINPIIKKISKDRKLLSEGCLSVRPLYGKVRRASRVTIEAYDKYGNKFKEEGTGLLAHIFQHEIDHLDGILFTDKAKDIYKSEFLEVK